LDLFAGTGNLSVEALSRGAAEAILVDSSHKVGRIIRENLRTLGLSDRSAVWTVSVPQSIRLLSRKGETFDLIFLDPPYEKGWAGKILSAIAREGLLRDAGMVVAEHSSREVVRESYGPLRLEDQRQYGSSMLSFFSAGGKR
jgi:16S rRNA (guanine(966)-N(2))-methyltransferase RsmD